MNLNIKKSFKKRAALIVTGVAMFAVVAAPVSTYAFSSGFFNNYRKDWITKYCTKHSTNGMYSAICSLIDSDKQQQEEIDQLTARVDALENGDITAQSSNLKLQIEGVTLGEAVSVNNPVKFFSESANRVVELTVLGDTVSNENLTYHFGIPQNVYYTGADCTGTPYVAFGSDDEKERILNNVILNGVNEHYVVDRTAAVSTFQVGSVSRLNTVSKTNECVFEDTIVTVNAIKANTVTMPVSEPLAKPFLFVYE